METSHFFLHSLHIIHLETVLQSYRSRRCPRSRCIRDKNSRTHVRKGFALKFFIYAFQPLHSIHGHDNTVPRGLDFLPAFAEGPVRKSGDVCEKLSAIAQSEVEGAKENPASAGSAQNVKTTRSEARGASLFFRTVYVY